MVQSTLKDQVEKVNRSIISVQDVIRVHNEAQTERWQEMVGELRNVLDCGQETTSKALSQELVLMR
jgi:hypothetical protein